MEDKNKQNQHFRLHIEPAKPAGHHSTEPKKAKKTKPAAFKLPHKKEEPKSSEKPPTKKKRTVKSFFGDFARQIIASVIILVVGFLLLNSSAYYQIFKNRIANYFGLNDDSILHEIAEEDARGTTRTVLETSVDPESQKNQIPGLDLEVAPFDDRIIIPRINQNIPMVRVSSASLIKRDWAALENDIQEALRDGVVHYPGTSLPGQTGNVVVTGHSSYWPFDKGRFKDVFALLHDMEIDDKIVIYFRQEKHVYQVKDIKIVLPDEIEVLRQTPDDRLTLITCTPVGTNLKRLIVIAEPITETGAEKLSRN